MTIRINYNERTTEFEYSNIHDSLEFPSDPQHKKQEAGNDPDRKKKIKTIPPEILEKISFKKAKECTFSTDRFTLKYEPALTPEELLDLYKTLMAFLESK